MFCIVCSSFGFLPFSSSSLYQFFPCICCRCCWRCCWYFLLSTQMVSNPVFNSTCSLDFLTSFFSRQDLGSNGCPEITCERKTCDECRPDQVCVEMEDGCSGCEDGCLERDLNCSACEFLSVGEIYTNWRGAQCPRKQCMWVQFTVKVWKVFSF